MSGRVGGTIEQMNMMGTQFNNEADTLSALVGRITGAAELHRLGGRRRAALPRSVER